MKNLAIFASGNGSNAEAIIEYFKDKPNVKVVLVLTGNPKAGVLKIAHQHKVISTIVSKEALQNEEVMNKLLGTLGVDFIALAGFLQMVPAYLLKKYPNRIVNIHPALLPKFGGAGMYGIKVHEAVLAAGETETGCTIHYVNDKYDEGEVISQKRLAISPGETPESLAARVLELEHTCYPQAIEQLL